jgi:hypothetical protein
MLREGSSVGDHWADFSRRSAIHSCNSNTAVGMGALTRTLTTALLAVIACLAAACGPSPQDAPGGSPAVGIEIPPDLAPPEVVLHAYLEAVRAGDCVTAGRFVVPATFRKGTGELCGAVQLRSYRNAGTPLTPSATEIIFGMTLTTGGSADGSIPAGDFLWSYDLIRQASGAWRIVNAGQG